MNQRSEYPAKTPNFPQYAVPLVGREREIKAISDLLKNPTCRPLTLLGPGGSGKTRLSRSPKVSCTFEGV